MNKSSNYSDLLSQVSLDEIYIQQVFDYYFQCYQECKWAQEFVQQSISIPDQMKQNSVIGLCDRTLGSHLPPRRSLEGGAIRGGLQRVGLLVATGGELFRGCIVFPETDEQGRIIAASGYRFASRIRAWQKARIYWKRPSAEEFCHQGMELVREVLHAKAYQ